MKTYPAAQIRNVGLFSHGGIGKTTLAEAMLYASGATSRLGKVLDGTTVSDYDPDEIKRHSSISATVIPVEHNGCKLNVVDCPGYSEFVGEMTSAMRVVDCAVILVDAHSSIEVGSDLKYREAAKAGIPRVVVVNKMDRENADFHGVVEQMRSQWGNNVVPLLLPIGQEQSFQGVADVLTGKAYMYPTKGDRAFEERPMPEELTNDAERYKEMLTELVAETDDELTMKYLDGGELTPEEMAAGLRAGILAGTIVPVLAASAGCLVGAAQLMDFLADLAPSPLDRPEVAQAQYGAAVEEFKADPDGPLGTLVFKTVADPFVGKLSLFRVYSGTLTSDSHVRNARTDHDERIGQLYFVRGKEQKLTDRVGAGDIGAVAKLSETSTGDTLASPTRPVLLRGIEFPQPSYTAALRPKTKADLDKMGTALHRMAEEDPTLKISRDPITGETLVSGMGESHIQIMAERMQRKFGVGVEIALPTVPYRETITAAARAEYKHKKQTGGHGQYGHVVLNIEPNAEQEFEFASTVVGGAVPRNYFPAVEKGVHQAMVEGVVAGFPIVNVRVTLTDGSYHNVDSSEMAFMLAASQAFKKGVSEARPVLLEPMMEVSITVPDQLVGDVMSDLNGRRARVEGMDPSEDGMTTVRAQAPLAEMQRYSSDLRAITQGRGLFSMEFSHYDEVPAHLTAQVVQHAKEQREAAATH
ncbi:MAG: elongation factor G [Chloroflexota bacterium]|nr:elongation factor G [Chloroflexota bacterium]